MWGGGWGCLECVLHRGICKAVNVGCKLDADAVVTLRIL